MTCQTCQKKEATIHYFESVNGQSRTMNLCDTCAAQVELGDLNINVQIQVGSSQLNLDKASYNTLAAKPQGGLRCVGCGMEFADFLAVRQYQCPACRDTFSGAPSGAAKAASDEANLKAQLDEAVASEDYERAAAIRDQLQETNHV